jgi:hypothetical protein
MRATEPIEVSTKELEALLEQATQAPLQPAGYQKLRAAIHTLGYVTELLENREATLANLRRLLCQSSTEKTKQVLKQAGLEVGEKKHKPVGKRTAGTKPPGHGRNGASAYQGAQRIQVQHASLSAGDRCPDCERGKVYPLSDPGVLVRIKGQAPIDATVWELEKLRCNLCGEVFTAEAPAEVGEEKYDATAASMIALPAMGVAFPEIDWMACKGTWVFLCRLPRNVRS